MAATRMKRAAVLREHGIAAPAGTGGRLLRLPAQPAAVLRQRGPVAAGTDLQRLESGDQVPTWTVVLPPGPSQVASVGQFTDHELAQVAGGGAAVASAVTFEKSHEKSSPCVR